MEPSVPDDDTRENSRGWWFSKPHQQFSSRVSLFSTFYFPFFQDITDIADGFDQSVETALDFIKHNGPFDGFLGFSQGASMVHLLLAMEKLNRAQLDVRFAIFFSGFSSLSTVHDDLTSVRFSNFPSLHIYGKNDQIVLPETSKKLALLFDDHKYIEHDGGHFIPSLTKFKQDFLSFLSQF